MFDPWCPSCAARVLMGTRRLRAVRPLPGGGHVVILRCHCGTVVTQALRPDPGPTAITRGSPALPTSDRFGPRCAAERRSPEQRWA